MIAVVVVPMFDPKVIGYAVSRLTKPAPQSGVKVEVKTDEERTRIVITAPERRNFLYHLIQFMYLCKIYL